MFVLQIASTVGKSFTHGLCLKDKQITYRNPMMPSVVCQGCQSTSLWQTRDEAASEIPWLMSELAELGHDNVSVRIRECRMAHVAHIGDFWVVYDQSSNSDLFHVNDQPQGPIGVVVVETTEVTKYMTDEQKMHAEWPYDRRPAINETRYFTVSPEGVLLVQPNILTSNFEMTDTREQPLRPVARPIIHDPNTENPLSIASTTLVSMIPTRSSGYKSTMQGITFLCDLRDILASTVKYWSSKHRVSRIRVAIYTATARPIPPAEGETAQPLLRGQVCHQLWPKPDYVLSDEIIERCQMFVMQPNSPELPLREFKFEIHNDLNGPLPTLFTDEEIKAINEVPPVTADPGPTQEQVDAQKGLPEIVSNNLTTIENLGPGIDLIRTTETASNGLPMDGIVNQVTKLPADDEYANPMDKPEDKV